MKNPSLQADLVNNARLLFRNRYDISYATKVVNSILD